MNIGVVASQNEQHVSSETSRGQSSIMVTFFIFFAKTLLIEFIHIQIENNAERKK